MCHNHEFGTDAFRAMVASTDMFMVKQEVEKREHSRSSCDSEAEQSFEGVYPKKYIQRKAGEVRLIERLSGTHRENFQDALGAKFAFGTAKSHVQDSPKKVDFVNDFFAHRFVA